MKSQTFFQRHPRVTVALLVFLGIFTLVRGGMDLWNYILRSGNSYDTIMANAYPGGETLTLPLRSQYNMGDYHAYGGVSFTRSATYAKTVEKVIRLCGAENVEEYNSKLLIHQVDSEGVYHYYLLNSQFLGSDHINFYGMKAAVEKSGDMSWDCSPKILLPFHLIEDDRISGKLGPVLCEGAEYQLDTPRGTDTVAENELPSFMLEKFFDFYGKSAYEVQKRGDELVLLYGDVLVNLFFRSRRTSVFQSYKSFLIRSAGRSQAGPLTGTT